MAIVPADFSLSYVKKGDSLVLDPVKGTRMKYIVTFSKNRCLNIEKEH